MEFCEMKNKNKTTSTVNNIKNSITCTSGTLLLIVPLRKVHMSNMYIEHKNLRN